MNVKQLIAKLKKLDQYAKVLTRDHDNSADEINGYVQSVEQTHTDAISDWKGESGIIVVIEC